MEHKSTPTVMHNLAGAAYPVQFPPTLRPFLDFVHVDPYSDLKSKAQQPESLKFIRVAVESNTWTPNFV